MSWEVTVSTETAIPTDLYYACLEGQFDWDANGNGIYGEPEDSCNLTPSVAVTRLPLSFEQDVSSFITKLIDYEKKWEVIPKLLLTGAEMHGTITEGQGSDKHTISDAELNGNYVYANGIEPYWDGIVEKKFDTSGVGYTLTAPFVAQQISKGYAFIDMQSHGEPAGWVFPNGASFNKDVAPPKIKNKAYTIITTNACNVNAFDKSNSITNPCLSQYLIADPINGIVAFYGNAREGIGINLGLPGLSQRYEMAFYAKLFSEPRKNKSFGKIAALSKKGYILAAEKSNNHRWLQYGINAIGDPEMPIYVTAPLPSTQCPSQ